MDKTLSEYNSEMLSIAGTLCRIIYENEMGKIARSYNDTDHEQLEKWAAYALAHFTFNSSTPNEQVGTKLESQFFQCNNELSILSTNGVFPISNVRRPSPEITGFMKNFPIVPKIMFEQCGSFFKKARDMDLIGDVTLQDVLDELGDRTFSENETIALLKWWIYYRSKGVTISSSEFEQFMKFAHIGNRFRALNTINYFLNPSVIPPDVDIPDEVLPYSISRDLDKNDLVNYLGWEELSLVNWVKFIVRKPELESSPAFARTVHQILTRSFNRTSKDDKKTIRQLLVQKKCIPTKLGMRFPSESYFQNVTIFPNLPTIDFPRPPNVQNLMELLGVRKVRKE